MQKRKREEKESGSMNPYPHDASMIGSHTLSAMVGPFLSSTSRPMLMAVIHVRVERTPVTCYKQSIMTCPDL